MRANLLISSRGLSLFVLAAAGNENDEGMSPAHGKETRGSLWRVPLRTKYTPNLASTNVEYLHYSH